MYTYRKAFLVAMVSLGLCSGAFYAGAETATTQMLATNIFLPQGQEIKSDYFGAGKTVDVASAVMGDIYVAGGTVNVTGPIAGDVVVAGGTVRITGDVDGNVRAVGGTIEIDGFVARNISVAGGNLVIGERSIIGGSVFAAGGSIEMRGKVLKNVKLAGSTMIVSGIVGGNTAVYHFGTGENKFSILSSATLNNGLSYTSPNQVDLKEGATIKGSVDYSILQVAQKKPKWDLVFKAFWLMMLGAKLLATVLIAGLLKRMSKQIAELMINKVWQAVLWGFIFAAVVPFAAFFLLFTVVGIPLSFLASVLYMEAMFFTSIFAGIAAGKLLCSNLKIEYKNPILPSLVGVFLLQGLTLVPWIGFLLWVGMFWWGFGGMLLFAKDLLKDWR
jgi:hypothetical protein